MGEVNRPSEDAIALFTNVFGYEPDPEALNAGECWQVERIDAALRRAKAEGWREAIMGVTNLKADMENGVPPSERMGFSRACNEIIGYARAAQIEEGE